MKKDLINFHNDFIILISILVFLESLRSGFQRGDLSPLN
jgi:hypothetical protein